MSKFIDMTGWVMKEHGVPDSRLTVVGRSEDYISPNGYREIRWDCTCECGTQHVIVDGTRLKSGKTKSCGCLRVDKLHDLHFKDLTNQQFGRLTARYVNKEATKNDKHRRIIWHCDCICGNSCDVAANNLTGLRTRSCGCLQKEMAANINSKEIRKYDQNGNLIFKLCPCCNQWLPLTAYQKRKQSIDGYASMCKICSSYKLGCRYSSYRTNANSHGRAFDLTLEDFDDITKQPCYYCGGFNGVFQSVPFSGVDRIDSSKGYTKDNVVPCCGKCNRMKGDLPQDKWIQHLQKILNHLKIAIKKEIGE